ncbi:uncharacterized protein LOC144921958 isoform X44 [Branchiostoma floridae x Branchiostoma belcheri]
MAEEAPGFRQPIKSIAVIKGKPAKFEAIVTGTPEPEVSWYVNGKEVASTDNTKISREEGGRVSLVLTSVTDEGGNIACTARNSGGTASSTAKLVVREPPDFVQRLKSQRVKEGSRVEMVVRFKGTPMPKIRWYRERAELQSTEDFRIVTEGDTSRLVIEEVYEDDSGKFSATATNVVGRVISAAHLMVTDTTPPATPTGRLSTPGKLTPGASPGLAPSPAGAAAAPVTPMTGAPVPKDAAVVKPLAVKPAEEPAPVAVKAGEKRPAEVKAGEIPAAKKVASKEDEQKPVPMEVDQAAGKAAGEAGIPRVAGDGQEEVRPAAEGTDKEAKAFPSPLGVKASDVADTSVTLKWTPVTGATDYRVAVTPPDGQVVDPVGGPSVWERTVAGLRPGQEYVFTVTAIGPEGQSNPSKPVKISTAGATGKAKVISPQTGKKKQASVEGGKLSREGSAEDTVTSPSQLRRQGDLVRSPSQLRRQGTDDSASVSSFHTATGEEVMSISSYATAEAGTQEGSPSVQVPQPKLFMSGLLSGIPGAFSSLHAGQAGLPLNQQQAQMASEVSTIEEMSEGEEDELSGAPEFNRGLGSCQVARGESVRFECEISGSPPPTIIWLKDGKEIDEDNQHFAKYGDDGSFALVITNVTDADSGAYSCQATNKKGQATSTAELTVKPHSIGGEETRGEKIAPIFAAKLTGAKVAEGTDARFDCVVAGTPGIEVRWFKDGVPVGNGGNRLLTFRGDGSCSLDVKDVTCDDAGVYEVQAANIAGTTKCSALLVVQQLEQKNSVHTHKPASQPVSLATIQEEVKVQDLKPPTEISASYVSDTAITVSWKPVAGATDYNVIVSPADGVVRGSDDGPTFPERRVEGLKSGTEYTFTVVATRKNGHAVAGVPLTQTTREVPTPGALRSESVTDTGLTLAWLPTPGATDYEVSISPPGGDVHPPSGATTEPQRVISGLEPGKEYEVTVTAKIGNKRSAQGESFKVTTKPLGTPAGFSANKITDNSMFVSWTPVSGATDYEVKLDPPAGEVKPTEKGSTVAERQLTGLSGGIEYRISVGAKNQKGDLVWAEPFSVETKDLPTPSGTGVSGLTDNEITVTWAPVPGATDYVLKVQPQVGEVQVPPEGPGEARRLLTGLLPGVDYTIVVEAKGDKRKRSAPCAPMKVKTKALCSPSDIKTSSVTASSAMLEWEMVPGATDYKVHMEPSDGQVTKPKKGGHLPQREVKNLTPGKEYVFTITAVSPAGNSAPSQEVRIGTPEIAGPSDLKVPTVTDTEATLSWAPVPGAKDYKFRTQPKHGDVATPTGDATSAQRTISGLHPGTNYSVYVSAVTDQGVGAESQPAHIKTKALPCPCSLNASEATDSEFKVAWLPVEGAENYVVTIDPPGGQVSEVTGNPSTPARVISGLEAGREYRVSVTATGKKGDSAPCEPFSVKTKVLCAPAGISATAITASSFEVTWTPVRGASEYEVRMNPDSGKVEVPEDGPSAPRRSITGLSAGIEYQITIVAKKESGAAQPSEPFMVKTRTLQSPKGLNAPWVTDSDLTLTWAKVRGATDYTVRLQPPAGEVTETENGPTAPERRVTGLLPGTEYKISVEAVGSEGRSSPSHIKIATKPLRAPFDLAATSITDRTMLVSWPAVPGATDYRVTMDPPDGEVTVARNAIAESKREIKGLQAGKEYQITVLALSPVGSSAPSESFVVKTRALAAPSGISPATVTDNSAGLKWTAVPGATDYTLTVEPAGGEVWETQAGPGDPERVITGLQSGTEYEITVSATGPDGTSAPSERIKIKTEALAAPSEIKQATVANEEIVLKWNPVPGATDYELTVEPPAGDIVAMKGDRARPMRRLTGLTPGTEYKIVVVAKDAKGNARKSDTISATTLNIPKAEGLRAYDITDTTVYLRWAAISGSKDYTINLRPSAIASVSAPENDMRTPERLVQGLQPSTEYNISVSAITADGRGPPCNPVTIVTKALPMPEDFKLVNVTDEAALISWAPIEGAKDFHVAVEPAGPEVAPTEAGEAASERVLRGLQPARDYWVTVTAKNEKGESNESQTFAFKTMALATPSGFKASRVTDTTCVLSWTPVSGSEDYTVKVQPQGGEVAVPPAGPSASERHLKRLKGKTTYTVTIVATSSKGTSAESQSFTFTTTELPSPSGVEVSSVTASGLVLAWSPVSGATDYIVTSQPDARVSPGEGGKSDAKRVVSGLEPGTEYTFTVVAVSTEGSSAACEPVKVKTRVLDTPAKIEAATATTNTAVITWTAVKGATDYKLVVEPPGAEVLVDKEGPAAPKRILKGLHPDTHYHVYVTAISAAGESTRSEALEIQTAALPSPARLSAPTVTDRSVLVSWAPTEGAEEYIVKVEPECEVVPTAGGPGAPERELRNLKPATEYTIRVAARGPLGTSADSEPLPIRTNALPTPSKVEVPFVSDKEVRVSWPAVPGATDYHVKTQPEASVQPGEGGPGAPERLVTGLKPNTEYSIRVVALTKEGSSAMTEPVKVTTKALETPSKIQPASTTADTAVITWSAVKGATDYKVVVEPSGPEVVVDKEGPAAPKRILKGLHPDTEYIAYVTAVSDTGDSTQSEPFKLRTPGLPVPARLGTPTVTDRNVVVSWAPIEGAEEYIVKVEPECEVVPTAEGPGAPERELRNLKPATEYIVRVAAKFPQGVSAESEHLAIRTNALPAPTGVEVPFVSDKEVRVSWPAVPGATDYHVKTQPEASVQPGEGGPGAPERVVTGLNPKTEYSIRVVALTQKGSSALSEPVKVTTKALPRPNESKVKSVTDNSAIITWTGIQGAADYQISVEPKCEVRQTKKATAPERELRGLLSGTEYTVTITAVGKSGTSAVSEPLIVRTKALLPPADVRASSVTDSSLLLAWKPVEGATSYIISTEPDKARVQLVDDSKGKESPERLLTQLWPNTEYTLTIIAVNNDESSMECEPFKVKTLALSKPSRVTAGKVGDTSALLVWAPAEAATNYVLTVNPPAEAVPTDKGPSGPERVLKGLKTNTEYTVSVTAKNPDGTSAPSDEFVFKTKALPSPEQPSQATVTDTTATVTWAAVPGATDYAVKVDPAEGQVMETADGAGAPVRQIQGLKPGTEYKFVVSGKGEKGDGAECEPIVIKTNPLPSPAAVKPTSVEDNKLTLGWSAVPGATDYKIVSSPEDVQVVTRKGGRADSERVITGLRPGTEYSFSVVAVCPDGNSAQTEPVKVTTKALPTPGGVKAGTVEDTTATVVWSNVPGASDYTVQVEPTGEVVLTKEGPAAPVREIRGLQAGQEYRVAVVGKGPSGESAPCEPISIKTNVLATPSGIKPSTIDDNSVTLAWTSVPGATDYVISGVPDGAKVSAGKDGPAGAERVVTGLQAATDYSISVTAVSSKGESGAGQPVRITTKALPTPDDVAVSSSADSATITWAPVPGAKNYDIVTDPPAEVSPTDKGPSAAERVVKGLKPGTDYEVKIAATNDKGVSNPCRPIKFSTKACQRPTGVKSPSITDNQATITWSPVPGATDYRVLVEPAEGSVKLPAGGPGEAERTIVGLTAGAEYTVSVIGMTEKGSGEASEPVKITTRALPAPLGVKASAVKTTSVTLSWSPVTGAQDYRVEVVPKAGRVMQPIGGPATWERKIVGLEPLQDYEFTVVAVQDKEESLPSKTLKVTTVPADKVEPKVQKKEEVKVAKEEAKPVTAEEKVVPPTAPAQLKPSEPATVPAEAAAPTEKEVKEVPPTPEAITPTAEPTAPVLPEKVPVAPTAEKEAEKKEGTPAVPVQVPAEVEKKPEEKIPPPAPKAEVKATEEKERDEQAKPTLPVSVPTDRPVAVAPTDAKEAERTAEQGEPKQVIPSKVESPEADKEAAVLKTPTETTQVVQQITEEKVLHPLKLKEDVQEKPEEVVIQKKAHETTETKTLSVDETPTKPPTGKSATAKVAVPKAPPEATKAAIPVEEPAVEKPSKDQPKMELTEEKKTEAAIEKKLPETVAGKPPTEKDVDEKVKRADSKVPAEAGDAVTIREVTISEPSKLTTEKDVPVKEDVPPTAAIEKGRDAAAPKIPREEVKITPKPVEVISKDVETKEPGRLKQEALPGAEKIPTETPVHKKPEDAAPSKKPTGKEIRETVPMEKPQVVASTKEEEVRRPEKPPHEAYSTERGEDLVTKPPTEVPKTEPSTKPKDLQAKLKEESQPKPGLQEKVTELQRRKLGVPVEKPTVEEKLEERPTTLEAVEELMGAVAVPGPGAVPKGKKEQPREAIPEGEAAKPEAVVAKPKEAAKVLPAPAEVRVNHVSESGMSLGWSPVPGATRYEVAVQTEGIELLTGKTTNIEYKIDGLKPSKKYHYSVTAIGADGTRSAPSKTFHQMTKALSTPGGIKPSSLTETGATIAWKPVPGATNYSVSVSPAHGRVLESSGGASGAERRLTDLQPNTEYTVSIAAEGVKGTSATSAPVVIKTKDDEERKRREAEELRQKQQKEEEERKQQELLQRQKKEEQALLEKQRKEEEQRKQQELLDKQRREKEEKDLLEKQRREEEQRKQQELEKQRQEDKKRKELAEKERLAEEQRKQQELLDKQRQEEERKQKELLEKKSKENEEARKKKELEKQQREEEERKQKELLEKQRKLEEEKKQKELQEKQRQEEEQKKQLEQQRKEEEDRKQKALLEKKRKEEEERKQKELLEKQKKAEEEKKRKELEKKKLEDEKRQKEEERKKKELLEKKKKEEDQKQKELLEKKKKEEEDQKKKQLLEKKKKEEEAAAAAPEEKVKKVPAWLKRRQEEEQRRKEEEEKAKARAGEKKIPAWLKRRQEEEEKRKKEEEQKAKAPPAEKKVPAWKQRQLEEEEKKKKEAEEKAKAPPAEKKVPAWKQRQLEEEERKKKEAEEKAKAPGTEKKVPTWRQRQQEEAEKKKKEAEEKAKVPLAKKVPPEEKKPAAPPTEKKAPPAEKKVLLVEKEEKKEEEEPKAVAEVVEPPLEEEVEQEEELEEPTGISAFAEARQAAMEQQSVEVRQAAPVVTIDASAYAAMAIAHYPTSVRTSQVQDRTLMLNWDPVVGAEDYDVSFDPCGDAEVFLTDYGPVAPMRKIRGLKPCKTYKITVSAKKANKERTKESEVIKVTTKALPSPSEFRAIRCLDNKVLFGFDAVYGATSYIVGTDSKEGVSRVTRMDYDRVEVEISDLLPATEYQVTVTAQGPKGVSAPSKYFTIGTKVITEPEDLVAKADSENDMTVTWSHVKGATDYEFLISPEGKVKESGATARKVSGLKPGVEYRISVAAKKGELVGSSAVTRSFTKALARPESMRCVSASDTSVIVAWNRVQGATGYDVETRPAGGTAITPKLPGAPEREITGLRPATEYQIIITGRSSRGDGLASQPLKVKTKAFGAVSSIRVTNCTDTTATIRWSPVNGATSYDVKLDPSEGRIRQTNGSQSPERQITGLVPNKEYSVIIVPKSASGEGSVNKPFTFTTMALSTPSNIKVTDITEEGLSLTWDEVPGAYDYSVWMDPPGATIIPGSGGARAPERHISRLKSNKEYSITIVAESPRGDSCRSDPVEVTTEALHGPTGLKTTNITQTGMRLSFNPVANARDYEVILRPRLGTVFAPGRGNDPSQPERIIEDLKPNTEYDISVIAITNKGVKSEVSKSIKRRTYAFPPPSGVTATSTTGTTVALQWPAVPGADNYTVDMTPRGGEAHRTDKGASAPERLVKGLQPGTVYEFSVTAKGKGGQSPPGETFKHRTKDLVSPKGFEASSVTDNSIVLSWTPVKGASKYNVTTTSFETTAESSAGEATTEIKGLKESTEYTFVVTAEGHLGKSAPSAPFAHTTRALKTPVGLKASSVTHSSMTITWAPIAGATDYAFEVKPEGANVAVTTKGKQAPERQLTNLKEGTEYRVVVLAVSSHGMSAASEPLIQQTSLALSAPTGLRVTSVKETSLTVVWGSVKGATSYDVSVDPAHGKVVAGPRGLTQPERELQGLNPGTDYTIRVVSKGLRGQKSADSAPITQKTKVLSVPQRIKVKVDPTAQSEMEIQWTPVEGAANYKITLEPPTGVDSTAATSDITKQKEFRVKITAVDEAGQQVGRETFVKKTYAEEKKPQVVQKKVVKKVEKKEEVVEKKGIKKVVQKKVVKTEEKVEEKKVEKKVVKKVELKKPEPKKPEPQKKVEAKKVEPKKPEPKAEPPQKKPVAQKKPEVKKVEEKKEETMVTETAQAKAEGKPAAAPKKPAGPAKPTEEAAGAAPPKFLIKKKKKPTPETSQEEAAAAAGPKKFTLKKKKAAPPPKEEAAPFGFQLKKTKKQEKEVKEGGLEGVKLKKLDVPEGSGSEHEPSPRGSPRRGMSPVPDQQRGAAQGKGPAAKGAGAPPALGFKKKKATGPKPAAAPPEEPKKLTFKKKKKPKEEEEIDGADAWGVSLKKAKKVDRGTDEFKLEGVRLRHVKFDPLPDEPDVVPEPPPGFKEGAPKFQLPDNMKETIELLGGQPCNFTIPIDGTFKPEITIMKDNKPIELDERVKIYTVGNLCKVKIAGAERLDRGKYKIDVKTPKGTDTTNFTVNVKDTPSQPKGPVIFKSVMSDNMEVSWQLPDDDGGAPLQGFELEICESGKKDWKKIANIKDRKHKVTGLKPDTRYQYRVTAINEHGKSTVLKSGKVMTKHPEAEAAWDVQLKKVKKDPPDPPQNVRVTKTAKKPITQAQLVWDKPISDHGSRIKGYVVERKKEGSSDWMRLAEAKDCKKEEFLATGFSEGFEYWIRIRAVNAGGESEPAPLMDPEILKIGEKTPPPPPKPVMPPGPVQNLQAEAKGDGHVTINWKPPKDRSNVTGYVIQKLGENDEDWVEIGHVGNEKELFNVHGLDSRQNYNFRVIAQSMAGAGEPAITETISLKQFLKPSASTDVSATVEETEKGHETNVRLNWTPPTDGSIITGFRIEKKPKRSTEWSQIVTVGPDETTYLVEDMTPDEEFDFRIVAESPAGDGKPGGTSVLMPPAKPPEVPPELGFSEEDIEALKQDLPGPLRIVKGLTDLEVPIRTTALYYCVLSKINIMVRWMCGYTDILPGKKYQTKIVGRLHILWVSDCRYDDEGIYKVEIPTKEASTAKLKIMENWAKPGRRHNLKPFFETPLVNYWTDTGMEAQMTVKYGGYPTPKIRWNRGLEMIRSGPKYEFISADDEVQTLIIKNVAESDAGEYTVTITNEAGEKTSTGSLIVGGAGAPAGFENQFPLGRPIRTHFTRQELMDLAAGGGEGGPRADDISKALERLETEYNVVKGAKRRMMTTPLSWYRQMRVDTREGEEAERFGYKIIGQLNVNLLDIIYKEPDIRL